ncbi:hypothetical protein PHAVU_006G018300 [Phaseolus vulgaris]|uniref:Uncharacterized protein n=1 Tax=Phaseolus vulgaris TaxID=3885 RepID=V7BMC0_PHAVU|nr:hypothetical protein PHAVU_006G018300g [Phaseolus vulgaris]ESW18163.1 hypothetical protein PHAVU_006G018300g [Phaseolus vulgaris]
MDANHTLFSSVTLLHEVPLLGYQVYNVCVNHPMKIVSDGMWSHASSIPSQSSYTILQLQIVIIFIVTQSFHFILKQLGIPYFVSQVMAGLLLGPSIPAGPWEKYKKMLFPFGSADILNTVSSLGYSFYLFLNSVQMDLRLITKTGRKAWVIGLCSYFIPIILGCGSMNLFRPMWKSIVGDEISGITVVFITQSSCSFAVISSLLNDLKILNSELGRLALSASFVNDVSGAIWAGVGAAFFGREEVNMGIRMRHVGAFLAFITFILLIGRPAMRWIVKKTPEGRSVNKAYIYGIIVVFLGLGYFARYFGESFLVGVIIFGLAVPEGPPLGSQLVTQLELFSKCFLSSMFLTSCTMKMDLTKWNSLSLVIAISCVIVVVHLIRWVLCMGICRYCKIPFKDGFCLALILSCKGIVDICSYLLIYETMTQSRIIVDVMIISVLVLGTISTLGVRALYDPSRKYAGYQNRNIMNLKHSELRIVACIHKPWHSTHIKNVLEFCSPAPDNPLVAEILHLMELVGRSNPIFIEHKLQQSASSSYNYSGELIVAFDLFERDYVGCVTANTYTAISPVIFMHEDVCNLALDTSAALIVLPFHVKWGGDGSVESEDSNIRALNEKILARAPCSIGILVNRGPSFNSTSIRAAMVFLGGPDDREALCLARRFAKDADNRLFVFRLLAHDKDSSNWDHMIDDEALREINGAHVNLENIRYEEITIGDASQTMFLIKDIANKFDFIVVGRRYGVRSPQTFGLEDWTEYSELGVIGDLLASHDTDTTASVLVVQQQPSHEDHIY